jgi:hypothetical protein
MKAIKEPQDEQIKKWPMKAKNQKIGWRALLAGSARCVSFLPFTPCFYTLTHTL